MPASTLNILFVGDVVGSIGRRALTEALPRLREKYAPNCVIANIENIAHGFGITPATVAELDTLGIDVYTGGNHSFDKREALELYSSRTTLLRPLNFPPGTPGNGSVLINIDDFRIVVLNLMGRVFFKAHLDCPFRTLDTALTTWAPHEPHAVFVDFHAEATSEKVAFGNYADGRVSAVVGTHTHIGTVDTRILPGGTAYVTDVGMTGAVDSILGGEKAPVIEGYLTQMKSYFDPVETGEAIVGAALIKIDPATRQAISIERVDTRVVIT